MTHLPYIVNTLANDSLVTHMIKHTDTYIRQLLHSFSSTKQGDIYSVSKNYKTTQENSREKVCTGNYLSDEIHF